jgi:hypothetical protein
MPSIRHIVVSALFFPAFAFIIVYFQPRFVALEYRSKHKYLLFSISILLLLAFTMGALSGA